MARSRSSREFEEVRGTSRVLWLYGASVGKVPVILIQSKDREAPRGRDVGAGHNGLEGDLRRGRYRGFVARSQESLRQGRSG